MRLRRAILERTAGVYRGARRASEVGIPSLACASGSTNLHRFLKSALLPLLLVAGCQDKKPEPSVPAGEVASAVNEITRPGAAPAIVPGIAPLSGTFSGKPFRPERIAFDGIAQGTIASFATADETIQLFIPGLEG